MIRISQMKIKIPHTEEEFVSKIKKTLNLKQNPDLHYEIVKKSIDARKKPELFYVYTVDVDYNLTEKQLLRLHNPNVSVPSEKHYCFPERGALPLKSRPIIIGAGPAGLFAAYVLAEMGYYPIVLERGKTVDNRTEDVNHFWKEGVLHPDSNVQFGEGGAGTFSDGKLNTVVKDSSGRNRFVLETFVRFGAQPEILFEQKPHIGTDVLCRVISNMRNYLMDKGCEFRFETCVTDFEIQNRKLTKVMCKDNTILADVCVLAIGHSSRDTFLRLYELEVPMEAKQFAVGFRVEHPQKMINSAMYGFGYEKSLAAAPYKVTSNFPNGRGVYSFCMCPGGYVVNASSMEDHTVVNGMSYSGRDSLNANSAIIVSVDQRDFGSEDALAGMYYQMKLEKENYLRAKGAIPQQLFGDFCSDRISDSFGEFQSETKGTADFCNLRGIYSTDVEQSFIEGMHHFAKIIPGFDRYDAILSGVETRTSSPIRIHRNELCESMVEGLYPCGEGAGYAGGIMSAAMDGMKVAEAIVKKYHFVG